MMFSTEAFDPFASDDDDDDDDNNNNHAPTTTDTFSQCRTILSSSTHNNAPSSSSSSSSPYYYHHADHGNGRNEFNTDFSPMTSYYFDNNHHATNENNDDPHNALFSFPTHFFPNETTTTTATTTNNANLGIQSGSFFTFIISEEMSVEHKLSTNQCLVHHVRGTISVESIRDGSNNFGLHYCDVSVRDPDNQLFDIHTSSNNNSSSNNSNNSNNIINNSNSSDSAKVTSNNMVGASRIASKPNTFRLNYLATNLPGSKTELNDYHSDGVVIAHPILEYSCNDTVRPVPMLVSTTIHKLPNNNHNYYQLLFTLRVNPRNSHSLMNATVLVHVPPPFDGANTEVFSVGRSIGRGKIDMTQWNDMTRILSWKLGELYSGAVCEFEAMIPSSSLPYGTNGNNVCAQEEDVTKEGSSMMFPILLRYDCEGSSLSNLDVEVSGGISTDPSSTKEKYILKDNPPLCVKRRFRVYHREV